MNNGTSGKILAGAAVVAVIGVGVAALSGVFNKGFTDGGVDVRNTACEDIASARLAVNQELEQRTAAAQTSLDEAMETASDNFWAENSRLEKEYHDCEFAALSADPCKVAFEEIGRLYEEIMADFAADKGFNEAKFNEREEAKKRYDECVEKQHKNEFYDEAKAACDATLATGRQANQQTRQAAEAAALAGYNDSVSFAQNAHQQKHAILDAIEEECNKPGGNTNVSVGALTTGATGTQIYPNNAACTGIFEGNDPDLRAELQNLENQLRKARAAGLNGGLFGSDHLQSAVDAARQRLRESERTCTVDADCGDPTPICCSTSQVGRVYCDGGTCASEQVDCVAPEICAGTPAACVNPTTGAQQSDGVYISRTIPEVGSCAQHLQNLNLQQATPDSVRYEIVGNIPGWVNINQVSGNLPANVNVSYSCNTVQGFGPGNYTANGSILVRNGAGDLINTIPLTISITVEPVAQDMIEVIQYGNYYIPLDQVHSGTGSECDGALHWHANSGSVITTTGMTLSDPAPSGCGFGKVSEMPVMTIPAVQAEVRGLEGLKTN